MGTPLALAILFATKALTPYIDGHAHLDPSDAAGSIRAALEAMPQENLMKIIFMPPPFTIDDQARFDAETILSVSKKYPDKVAILGGGGTLNAWIQESVQSGDAGPEVQRRFKERAEELLREGVAGFGEMTAEHFASTTAYQHAPPDHPLFLLLAEIAAEHHVPIDLHMEVTTNIAAFERLLAHDSRATIIWAHAGSDHTGYRTPDLCRRLLRAHPNLYMEIKIDPGDIGRNAPLIGGASGAIKPEWLKLFQDFPDRFMIGSDQHYPEPKTGPQRWQSVVLLLNQLPADLRRKIGTENADRIYREGRR